MPNTHNAENPPPDRTVYRSPDGLVEVRIKTHTANRWPRHEYPIACLLLKAARASRIQQANDGSGRIDVLLTNEEIAAFLKALEQCDPKYHQTVSGHVQPKCSLRKRRWDRINRLRHGQA